MIAELDLARVQRYCRNRVPQHYRNGVWHKDPIGPTTQLDRLLARLEEDPAGRYWG